LLAPRRACCLLTQLTPRLRRQANLRAVLALVARLRGTPEAELAELTWRNSRRLFRACLPDADADA
jgi:Tat protein secretion system quality control protein TatD with DNase activity